MKTDKTAQQAGQVVESMVNSYLQGLRGRSGGKRGLLRPVLGLLVVAGGAGAIAYAQADEAQREEAGKKVSELADTVLDQIGALSG